MSNSPKSREPDFRNEPVRWQEVCLKPLCRQRRTTLVPFSVYMKFTSHSELQWCKELFNNHHNCYHSHVLQLAFYSLFLPVLDPCVSVTSQTKSRNNSSFLLEKVVNVHLGRRILFKSCCWAVLPSETHTQSLKGSHDAQNVFSCLLLSQGTVETNSTVILSAAFKARIP